MITREKLFRPCSAPTPEVCSPNYMPHRPDPIRGLHAAPEFRGAMVAGVGAASSCIFDDAGSNPAVRRCATRHTRIRRTAVLSVFSSDALGLSSPPTDLHQMPDERILLYASGQIVLGDGVRWEVFHQAPETKMLSMTGVAVDRTGKIFTSFRGGFSQIKFGEDGFWRSTQVATWPATRNPNRPVPRSLIEVGNEWFWHSGSEVR